MGSCLGACDTSCVNDQDSGAERHINIHLSPEIMGGVYANFANVSHSDYEFTVTFARVDHEVEADEVPGVVVSRVNLSPRFMRELIDAMEDNYSKWQRPRGHQEPARVRRRRGRLRPRIASARVAQRRAHRLAAALAAAGDRGTPARRTVFVPCRDEGRRHLRHPRQPARLRGDARRGRRQRRRPSCGASATSSATGPSPTPASSSRASTPRCAWPATTTSPSPARSRWTSSPGRERRRAVDARGDRAREPRLPAQPAPAGRGGRRSASTTRARATPCGSTCSRRCSPSCAWTPSRSASA